MFNFFIAFGFLVSDTPDELDSEGWYTIPKAKVSEQGIGADEREGSVWVVFTKKVGVEKLLISFPHEPICRYLGPSAEEFEVVSQSENAEFRLQVLDRTSGDPYKILEERIRNSAGVILIREEKGLQEGNSALFSEVSYWEAGFWHHERVIATGEHTYLLQTKSTDYSIDSHHQFVQSFSV